MVQEYFYPDSVIHAIDTLVLKKGRAQIIAGGTDLVLQLQDAIDPADCLVDISRLSEMRQIEVLGDYIFIGAAVTHSELAVSPIINGYAPLLAQAAAEVGSPQIRNAGTIGGNVVNAQPAADTALALTALDAEAEIVQQDRADWLNISDLYAQPGISKVNSKTQIVRRFRFKKLEGSFGSVYRRLGKCKSIALPIICAAVIVQVSEGVINNSAIALGPVGPSPMRSRRAEIFLQGKTPAEETLKNAAQISRNESHPRESKLRCSRMYREALVENLVFETLQKAILVAIQEQ
jgi:CO/xanthine dehydrogenase FAD-binding subunit